MSGNLARKEKSQGVLALVHAKVSLKGIRQMEKLLWMVVIMQHENRCEMLMRMYFILDPKCEDSEPLGVGLGQFGEKSIKKQRLPHCYRVSS